MVGWWVVFSPNWEVDGGWVGCMLTQFTFPQHCNAFNCISLQQTAVAQQLLQPFDHFPDNQHCCIASAETGFTVQLDMWRTNNLQIWQSCAIFTLAEYIKRALHLKSAMYNQYTWMCSSVQRSFAISKVRRDARRSNAMQAGRRCWRQKSAMRRIAASALWPVKVTITSISFECRWSCVLSADMCVFRSICVKPSWSRFSANNQHWALMSNVRLVGKKRKNKQLNNEYWPCRLTLKAKNIHGYAVVNDVTILPPTPIFD